MILRHWLTFRKMSRRQNAQGYDAPSRTGASCRSSECVRIKPRKGTSHQPYEKRHVAGKGKTFSSPLIPGVDQSRSQSQCQGEVHGLTAPGIAKTQRASPV